MKTVTSTFVTKSSDKQRLPQYKVEIDWELDGTFQDESRFVKVIQVERSINEPLGGVALAQADVKFVNTNDRYTPKG